MSEEISLTLALSKWRKFIDNFNARVTKARGENNVPHPHKGLRLIDVNSREPSWSLAMQISGEEGKEYEYYIKIKWHSEGNKYLVSKNLMPYGVDVQKFVQDRTLRTFEDVTDLIKEVFHCCCAFHNRQKQVQDMKDFLKKNHWRMEVFFSHTLLYMRLGFSPLDIDGQSPSKERKHVFIELHYEQHQIRPSKIDIDCSGFLDEEMEGLKLQFTVFKKFNLKDALEFALLKLEDEEEDDDDPPSVKKEVVSLSEYDSSSESAVAGPSGTQQEQARSSSASSLSSSS